ncbi:hypothetical protein [Mesobacillus harenae]|uniref:hypothetical protein n=1 Tax=Mesobacillus harenae TaxID=2213203 RepID=UPI001580F41A|nr:hypothetical protein [Mesobacillus harenae]
MINIYFLEWGKNRSKKHNHYNRIHGMRIFELIFSKKLTDIGVELEIFKEINIYFLANPEKPISYEENLAFKEINIFVPEDLMKFLKLKSTEAKFQGFSELVYKFIVPAIEKYSAIPFPEILANTNRALNEVINQDYQAVFLVDKTPKKSPDQEKFAILKGIHDSEGFQLRCEVYNKRGLRIINQLLVEEVGNEVIYSKFFGELKWLSEHLIIVSSNSSDWKTTIHVS